MLFRYLRFLLRSTNAHGIHSPFIFSLYTQVIQSHLPHPVFRQIEQIRQRLRRDTRTIEVLDFGAGSKRTSANRRKIALIARYAQKNARLGQLLFRLVHHFQPQIIFDLGTSLGITTLYQAAANPPSTVYTFEGCPQTLAIAQAHFAELQFNHIHAVAGNIDKTLPATLRQINRLDFAFFDANHRLEPTLRYFDACLTKAHEDSVFVFDDIYWSREMTNAWQQIKTHPSVMLTVDLFFVGLVFFRKKQPKQHFALRF